MNIDVSRFKVVFGEKVLNALSINSILFRENQYPEPGKTVKPQFLEVVTINEDGNVVIICDETWRFQFIPIIQKGVIRMYESPINIIYGQFQTQLEGTVMKAVHNVGVDVDKEELIRALKYDRDQYDKGFRDGVASMQKWIPVGEPPKERGCYLISVKHWLDGKPVTREAKWNGADWLSCYGKAEITPRVTHWMPLPEPPEVG